MFFILLIQSTGLIVNQSNFFFANLSNGKIPIISMIYSKDNPIVYTTEDKKKFAIKIPIYSNPNI